MIESADPFDLEPVIKKIFAKGYTPLSLFTMLDENEDKILSN